jgi:hypothetical protein
VFTIRPYTGPPACLLASRQYAVAKRVVTKCPRRCTRRTVSHSEADIEKIIRSRSTPALLTTMSSRPYASSAAATSRSPVDHSPMSPGTTTALSEATTGSKPGRSLSTKDAPAPASASASARPSPLAAPVTIATRPSRLSRSEDIGQYPGPDSSPPSATNSLPVE